MRFEQTVFAALREAVRGRLSHRGLRRVVDPIKDVRWGEGLVYHRVIRGRTGTFGRVSTGKCAFYFARRAPATRYPQTIDRNPFPEVRHYGQDFGTP